MFPIVSNRMALTTAFAEWRSSHLPFCCPASDDPTGAQAAIRARAGGFAPTSLAADQGRRTNDRHLRRRYARQPLHVVTFTSAADFVSDALQGRRRASGGLP